MGWRRDDDRWIKKCMELVAGGQITKEDQERQENKLYNMI